MIDATDTNAIIDWVLLQTRHGLPSVANHACVMRGTIRALNKTDANETRSSSSSRKPDIVVPRPSLFHSPTQEFRTDTVVGCDIYKKKTKRSTWKEP